MLGKIPLRSHVPLDFRFLEDFLLLSFFTGYWSLQFFFFLTYVSVLIVVMFLGLYPFLPDCPIGWNLIFHSTLFYNCISVLFVISLSLIISFICVLSLFFLISLARGLSVLFFRRTRSWFH